MDEAKRGVDRLKLGHASRTARGAAGDWAAPGARKVKKAPANDSSRGPSRRPPQFWRMGLRARTDRVRLRTPKNPGPDRHADAWPFCRPCRRLSGPARSARPERLPSMGGAYRTGQRKQRCGGPRRRHQQDRRRPGALGRDRREARRLRQARPSICRMRAPRSAFRCFSSIRKQLSSTPSTSSSRK